MGQRRCIDSDFHDEDLVFIYVSDDVSKAEFRADQSRVAAKAGRQIAQEGCGWSVPGDRHVITNPDVGARHVTAPAFQKLVSSGFIIGVNVIERARRGGGRNGPFATRVRLPGDNEDFDGFGAGDGPGK